MLKSVGKSDETESLTKGKPKAEAKAKAEAARIVAGWAPELWCGGADIGRATFYKLPPEMKPHSVKIGKRRIIRESPADWLARIASAQRVA